VRHSISSADPGPMRSNVRHTCAKMQKTHITTLYSKSSRHTRTTKYFDQIESELATWLTKHVTRSFTRERFLRILMQLHINVYIILFIHKRKIVETTLKVSQTHANHKYLACLKDIQHYSCRYQDITAVYLFSFSQW